MLKVEKFLCFTLETGGLVTGWFFLASNALCGVLCVVGVIFLSILGCSDLQTLVEESGDEFNTESCEVIRIVLVIVLFIAAVLSFACAVVGWFCVSGTSKRNHNQIKPMVVILAVTTICSFLNILAFNSFGISTGLLGGIFYGYLFVCIYSLFYKIREEFERGFNPQYQVKADAA